MELTCDITTENDRVEVGVLKLFMKARINSVKLIMYVCKL